MKLKTPKSKRMKFNQAKIKMKINKIPKIIKKENKVEKRNLKQVRKSLNLTTIKNFKFYIS